MRKFIVTVRDAGTGEEALVAISACGPEDAWCQGIQHCLVNRPGWRPVSVEAP